MSIKSNNPLASRTKSPKVVFDPAGYDLDPAKSQHTKAIPFTRNMLENTRNPEKYKGEASYDRYDSSLYRDRMDFTKRGDLQVPLKTKSNTYLSPGIKPAPAANPSFNYTNPVATDNKPRRIAVDHPALNTTNNSTNATLPNTSKPGGDLAKNVGKSSTSTPMNLLELHADAANRVGQAAGRYVGQPLEAAGNYLYNKGGRAAVSAVNKIGSGYRNLQQSISDAKDWYNTGGKEKIINTASDAVKGAGNTAKNVAMAGAEKVAGGIYKAGSMAGKYIGQPLERAGNYLHDKGTEAVSSAIDTGFGVRDKIRNAASDLYRTVEDSATHLDRQRAARNQPTTNNAGANTAATNQPGATPAGNETNAVRINRTPVRNIYRPAGNFTASANTTNNATANSTSNQLAMHGFDKDAIQKHLQGQNLDYGFTKPVEFNKPILPETKTAENQGSNTQDGWWPWVKNIGKDIFNQAGTEAAGYAGSLLGGMTNIPGASIAGKMLGKTAWKNTIGPSLKPEQKQVKQPPSPLNTNTQESNNKALPSPLPTNSGSNNGGNNQNSVVQNAINSVIQGVSTGASNAIVTNLLKPQESYLNIANTGLSVLNNALDIAGKSKNALNQLYSSNNSTKMGYQPTEYEGSTDMLRTAKRASRAPTPTAEAFARPRNLGSTMRG